MIRPQWHTEQSPFRTANAEKRVGTKLRRAPTGRGYRLSQGCVDVLNDKRKAGRSMRLQRKLLVLLQGR